MPSHVLALLRDLSTVVFVATFAATAANRQSIRPISILGSRMRESGLRFDPDPTPRAEGFESPVVPTTGDRERPRTFRDIVYRIDGDRRVALDILLPAGLAPARGWPIVLAIHGGGWRRLDKGSYAASAASLVRHGYAVVAVDFLQSSPCLPGWPGGLEDIRESVRWIRRNARTYRLDPGRIAAMGESAGGHLAALLGTYPDGEILAEGSPPGDGIADRDALSTRVQAVIDFYGPTDLVALAEQTPQESLFIITQYLGGTIAQIPGRYEAASPIRHVSSNDPPMLLIHGSDDPYIDPSHSRNLAEALRAEGIPTRLEIVADGTHAEHGPDFLVGSRSLLPAVLDFLGTWLK